MKKGFTLVELLAVIAIIAILLLLIVTKLNEVIYDSRKSLEESSAKSIVKAADIYYTDHFTENVKDYKFDGITNIYNSLKVKGVNPDDALVRIKKTGEVEIRALFGKTCYIKGFSKKEVTKGDINLCKDYTVLLP